MSGVGFLFDAISINLFICLCVLVVEILVVHIIMIVCMIKYRVYRKRYQMLKDLKKFKDFVTKDVPTPVDTMDTECQRISSKFIFFKFCNKLFQHAAYIIMNRSKSFLNIFVKNVKLVTHSGTSKFPKTILSSAKFHVLILLFRAQKVTIHVLKIMVISL